MTSNELRSSRGYAAGSDTVAHPHLSVLVLRLGVNGFHSLHCNAQVLCSLATMHNNLVQSYDVKAQQLMYYGSINTVCGLPVPLTVHMQPLLVPTL